MFFVRIEDKIQEFIFETKKEALNYIVDFLKREDFDEPVVVLKKAEKRVENNADVIITKDYTFAIIKLYKYEKCSICEEPMNSNMKLNCNHYVCKECLGSLRKPECPVCRQNLQGDTITDEIYCKILHRTELDSVEEENNNHMLALLSTFGFDVNELY